ncbi:sodium-dependent bicarbonate transport family permease [Vicingaceae bacterium]|nr:sodium-dependent bicarbonate transport family permease [Vicingaceae bacterium]
MLVIGFVATEQQAEGVRPFTTELFKGFLSVFLLDMGITSGKKLSGL